MSQAHENKALKADIISHARVIYGLEYLMIDVVTSADPQGFVSHIVYYPKIAPYIEQGRVVTGGFKELLWSQACPGVQATYETLLQHLRSKMAATIMAQRDKDNGGQ